MRFERSYKLLIGLALSLVASCSASEASAQACPRAASASSGMRCELSGPLFVEVGEAFEIQWDSLNADELMSLGWQGNVTPKPGEEELDLSGSWTGLKLTKPGLATVQLRATNADGDVFCDHVIAAEDGTPPDLTIFSPADYGITTSRNALLGVIATDNDALKGTNGLTYSVNDGPIKTYPRDVCWGPACLTWAKIAPGLNEVKIFAEDRSGNVSEDSVNVLSDSGTGGLTCFINGPDEVQPDTPFNLYWYTHGGAITSMTSTWLVDDQFDAMRYVDQSNGSIQTLPDQNLPNPSFWGEIIKPAGDKPSLVTIRAEGPKGVAYCSAVIRHTDGLSCKLHGPRRVQVGEEFGVSWKTEGATKWKSRGWSGTFAKNASPPIDPYDLPKANGGWWKNKLSAPGLASVTVEVENAAGKKDTCDYSVVAVDTEPPTLVVMSPANHAVTTASTAEFMFFSYDNYKLHATEPLTYSINGGAPKPVNLKKCYYGICLFDVPITRGANTIQVTSQDVSGNTTTEQTHIFRDGGTGGLSCFINGPDEVEAGVPFDLRWYASGGSVTSLSNTWRVDDTFQQIRYVDPNNGSIKTLPASGGNPNPGAWTELVKNAGDKSSFVTLHAQGPNGEAFCSTQITVTDGLSCNIEGPERVDVNAAFDVRWKSKGATTRSSQGWSGSFAANAGPPLGKYNLPSANGTWSSLKLKEPGTAKVAVEVIHADGRKDRCDYSVVASDQSPPTVAILAPATDVTTSIASMNILFAAWDNWGIKSGDTGLEYRVRGGAWTPVDRSWCYWGCSIPVALDPGPNLVEVRARDKANRTGTDQVTITYQPVASCSYPGCYSSSGLNYYPIESCRAYGTGAGFGAETTGPKLQMNQAQSIRLSSTCGIPVDAVAVQGNVTIVNPNVSGSLSVYPGDAPLNFQRQLFYQPGNVNAGSLLVRLAADGSGRVNVRMRDGASSGQSDLLIDLNGYFK